MSQRKDRTLLRRFLDLSDEIDRMRETQREAAVPAERKDLARRVRQRMTEVSKLLKNLEGEGPLHLLLKRYRFGKHHVLLMLELLKRRLAGDDVYMKGRELLSVIFDSSFSLMEGIRLLSPTSRLITAGVVVPDLRGADDDAELLDLRYRLSDRAFRLLLRALNPARPKVDRALESTCKPYRNNLAYLMDLRRLSLLYRKRASKVFHFEYWDELGAGLPESLTLLNRQIPRFSAHIRACLEVTKNPLRFPLVKLAQEASLNEEHLVILTTLVFQELTEGTPYLDAVDLLKLVCRSEEDLVRKRQVFAKPSPLVRHGLVELEEVVYDKDLSAEIYIPNHVVDRILGGSGKRRIDPDSRIEFHNFLNEMDSSDDFFDRL
jgi:hypothetical protein